MRIAYFVHSITTDNEVGIATGWLPGKLSGEGRIRAKELASDLRDRQFDAVSSSDLRRAVESVDLFFDGRFPVFIDWRLRECSYGRLDGHLASEFKSGREPIHINNPYPGGESYKDVEQRMRSFLADASRRYDGRHIAIVAHQAPQLALDVIIGGQSWERAMANDWRATGNWQPGWKYEYINTPPALGAND